MSTATWRTTRLRFCLEVDPPASPTLRADADRVGSLLPMEAIGEQGTLDRSRETLVADASSGMTFVADGDVLLAKVTPCFENGKGAVVTGLKNGFGFATTEVYALRPIRSTDARYLDYLLRSETFRQYGAARLLGAGGLKRLSATDLRNFEFVLPSPEHQRAIADFLDRETARIDTLIEEQQRLIDLLRERRQTAIDVAFDGFPTDSRIAHGCVDVVDCVHTTPVTDLEGAYEAVRTASVRAGRFRSGHGLPVSEATWRERNSNGSPMLGDILFAREGGSAGEAALVPSPDICLGQRMVLLRVDHEICVSEFLLWQMYSTRIQDSFQLAMSGAAAGNVRLSLLRRTPIWLPSVAVQAEVAASLVATITKIDTLVAESERFIELSRERRSALITTALTGQIDVRDEAAS